MPDVEHIKSAKKRHRCDWCSEAIEVGQSYNRYRYFYPDVGTAKLHPECYDAMHAAYSEGIIYSDDTYDAEWPRGCYHDPIEKDCGRCRDRA